MNTRRWEWKLAGFAVLVCLVFVMTPELRVLLLLVDSIGLELIVILLTFQLRAFVPAIWAVLVPTRLWFCTASFFILRSILRTIGALMPNRSLAAISTLLYVWSRNLWCPMDRESPGIVQRA